MDARKPVSKLPPNSPLSTVFLLHIALEIPLGLQAFFSVGLPFIELTNTTLVFLRLYGAFILSGSLASLLCYGMPDIQPGKRVFAMMLVLYHSLASKVLIQAPRFIPTSFGVLAESLKFTPEVLWGSLHGILSLMIVAWWQATLSTIAMSK